MFGTYFPTFFLLSRSAFPSMCARRLFAARSPFANSAVLSPLRASSPRLRTTRTRTWGAPARVTGAAPAAAEKTGTTLRSGTARNQRHARGRPADGGAGRPSGLASGARVGCRGPSLQQNGAWRHVSAVPHPAKWNMADAIDDSVNEGLCSANPDLDPTKHENQAAYPDVPVRAGRLAGHVGAVVGHRLRAGEIRGPCRAPSVRIRSGRCFVDPVMDLIRGTPDYMVSTVVDAALRPLSGRSVGVDAFAPRACGARTASIPRPKATSVAQSCSWPQACCRTPPRRTASRGRRSSDPATIEARAQESAEQGKEHVALPDPRGRASAATASANGRRPRRCRRPRRTLGVCSLWEDVVKMISTVFGERTGQILTPTRVWI